METVPQYDICVCHVPNRNCDRGELNLAVHYDVGCLNQLLYVHKNEVKNGTHQELLYVKQIKTADSQLAICVNCLSYHT